MLYEALHFLLYATGGSYIIKQSRLFRNLLKVPEGALGLAFELRTGGARHFWEIHAIGEMVAGTSKGAYAIRAELR